MPRAVKEPGAHGEMLSVLQRCACNAEAPHKTYVLKPVLTYPAPGAYYCYAAESGAVIQIRDSLHTVLERLSVATRQTMEASELRRQGLTLEDLGELIRYRILTQLIQFQFWLSFAWGVV